MLDRTVNVDELCPIINEYFDNKIEECEKIHIGKSSYGWVFLFNLNDKLYYHDKASLIEFLELNYIEDEYGELIAFEVFWNNVVLGRPFTKSHKRNDDSYFSIVDGLEFLDCEFS